MSLEEYKKENSELANDILYRNYYFEWKHHPQNKYLDILLSGSACGKCHKCTYASTEPLYTEDNIIDNFKKILNWYIQENFRCDIKISSSSQFTLSTNFFKSLDVIYNIFSASENRPNNIIVPLNSDIFMSQDSISFLINIYNKLKELHININYEIDMDNITFNDEQLNNNLIILNNISNFILDCDSTLMFITLKSSNTNRLVEDIKMWLNTDDFTLSHMVFVEEYSSCKWDDSLFYQYQTAINSLIDRYIGTTLYTKEEKIDALSKIFVTDEKALPFQIRLNLFTTGNDYFNCDLHNALTIRCYDLSVFLCSNLCDERLLIGNFNSNDTVITDFNCNTVELFIVKEHTKTSCIPYCEQCPFVGVCDGICPAHSFSSYLNPFMPVLNECEFQRNKIEYLIKKYLEMGIFDEIESLDISKSEMKYLLDVIQLVGDKDGTK